MVVTRRNSVAALRRVSLVSVAAAAACFLLANCAIPAANAQVSPSADTFASTGTPILNYGSAPLLIVTAGTNTYIRFDLTSIPANSTVNKATLVLFVDAVTGNGAMNVYKLTNSLAESTLNELNAPALGASETSGSPVSITSASFQQFISIDLTSLVQQWVNGSSANDGIALALAGSAGGFSFDSKENALTSHQPQLVIELADLGPTGPQGPAGPTGGDGTSRAGRANRCDWGRRSHRSTGASRSSGCNWSDGASRTNRRDRSYRTTRSGWTDWANRSHRGARPGRDGRCNGVNWTSRSSGPGRHERQQRPGIQLHWPLQPGYHLQPLRRSYLQRLNL